MNPRTRVIVNGFRSGVIHPGGAGLNDEAPARDIRSAGGEQKLIQQYEEAIARQTALKQVLQHLQRPASQLELDDKFCMEQAATIHAKLMELDHELQALYQRHPQLQTYAKEQLQEQLLAIESDTYAEFIRSGLLTKELSPFLREGLEGAVK